MLYILLSELDQFLEIVLSLTASTTTPGSASRIDPQRVVEQRSQRLA